MDCIPLIVDGLYPTDEIRAEFIHDFQNCKEKIFLWKQHILRTVRQEAAKTSILENLKEDEILEHPNETKRGNTSKWKRKHKETFEDVNVVEGMTDVVDGVTDVVDEVTDVVDEEINEYTCGECDIGFTSLKDFNIHQDMGNHKIKSIDVVKMLWSEKCVDIKRNITKSSSTADFEIVENNITKGWALKERRVSRRFSKKLKIL